MTKYNAERARTRGESTIGQASVELGRVLWELQGRSVSHTSRGNKIIERTNSRKHYRVPQALVDILALQTERSEGSEVTEPPTALVSVHSMVEGLQAYSSVAQYYRMAECICGQLIDSQQVMQKNNQRDL